MLLYTFGVITYRQSDKAATIQRSAMRTTEMVLIALFLKTSKLIYCPIYIYIILELYSNSQIIFNTWEFINIHSGAYSEIRFPANENFRIFSRKLINKIKRCGISKNNIDNFAKNCNNILKSNFCFILFSLFSISDFKKCRLSRVKK